MMMMNNHDHFEGELLDIKNVEGDDIYNPSAPFDFEGDRYLLARCEQRGDEVGSITSLFQEHENKWRREYSFVSLPLQDPFALKIQDEWFVGGIKVYPKPESPSEVDYWETHIYRGPDPFNLEPWLIGPRGMKNIRLMPMNDGKVGVFTRPMVDRGRVGFFQVGTPDEITNELLESAPLIQGLYTEEEWGGVAEGYDLGDGTIGTVGHVARFQDGNKEYYGQAAVIDIDSLEVQASAIVACRDCFPETEGKRPDLEFIVFIGGIAIENEVVVVYCGLSDTTSGKMAVHLPFNRKDVL